CDHPIRWKVKPHTPQRLGRCRIALTLLTEHPCHDVRSRTFPRPAPPPPPELVAACGHSRRGGVRRRRNHGALLPFTTRDTAAAWPASRRPRVPFTTWASSPCPAKIGRLPTPACSTASAARPRKRRPASSWPPSVTDWATRPVQTSTRRRPTVCRRTATGPTP